MEKEPFINTANAPENFIAPETAPQNLNNFFEDEAKQMGVLDKIARGPAAKAARYAAALSIFFGASSFSAKGVSAQEIEKGLSNQDREATSEIYKPEDHLKIKNQTIGDAGWKKFIEKIDISSGGIYEHIPQEKISTVGNITTFDKVHAANFYKDFTKDKYSTAVNGFYDSIKTKDVDGFFKKLDGFKAMSVQQKVLILQNLGVALSRTYNLDMLQKNEAVEISDSEMFKALQESFNKGSAFKGGMCGNIHTFLVKTAKAMGLEAWLQSGKRQGGLNHVFAGLALDTPEGKEISFLDYGALVNTGTADYRDALGISERYLGRVATFGSYVGDENKFLFPVESRAQQRIKEAAGIFSTQEELERQLGAGAVIKEQNGLKIGLSPEVQKISLKKDHIGLAFFNYSDVLNNPYQSLKEMNALKLGSDFKGENFGIEGNVTYLHLSLKDLYNGAIDYDEIIPSIAANYIQSAKLTKGKYGELLASWGATFQAAMRLPLDYKIDLNAEGFMGESAAGARLIYLDPKEIGRFYVGVSELARGQLTDFQKQNLTAVEAARSFKLGADIKVRLGMLLSLEAAKTNYDWGQGTALKAGLAEKKAAINVTYEKDNSDFQRFLPSAETIGAAASYSAGPKCLVEVIGFKRTEKYADAEPRDSYGGEVRLKIFLW